MLLLTNTIRISFQHVDFVSLPWKLDNAYCRNVCTHFQNSISILSMRMHHSIEKRRKGKPRTNPLKRKPQLISAVVNIRTIVVERPSHVSHYQIFLLIGKYNRSSPLRRTTHVCLVVALTSSQPAQWVKIISKGAFSYIFSCVFMRKCLRLFVMSWALILHEFFVKTCLRDNNALWKMT